MKNPFSIDTRDRMIPSQKDIEQAIIKIRLDGFSAENISRYSYSNGCFLTIIKLFDDYQTAAFLAAEFICNGFRTPKWEKCMDGSITLQWNET